jgi:hypothetical protein
MANFVQGNFVIPVTPEDTQVYIKDKFGRIRFSIAPHQVTATFVKNNLIHVKTLGTDNVILIDFGNVEEAKRALPELQFQLDIGKKAPSLEIDPAIIEYIQQYVTGKISFAHQQMFATSSWGVTHSLGYRPNVMVTDASFVEVEGLVTHIDTNHLVVKFNQSVTGWALCT